MVGQFLAGVIVGVLIGLALAPVLRSWISWQVVKSWIEPASSRHDRRTTAARGKR
jgi:hypothetical protein